MKRLTKTQLAADTIPLIVADVFQLAGAFRRWGDTIAGEVGQTQARWQVLSAASIGDRSVAQLARRLGLARQGVQRIADLLVADGLMESVHNVDHRRSPLLRLTGRGNETLEKLTKVACAYHKELAEGLSVEELETALVVIHKLCMQLNRDLSSE